MNRVAFSSCLAIAPGVVAVVLELRSETFSGSSVPGSDKTSAVLELIPSDLDVENKNIIDEILGVERNVEGESTTIPYKGGVKFVIKEQLFENKNIIF